MRMIAAGIVALSLLGMTETILAETAPRQSAVGIPATIDQLVLPGPEREVAPIEDFKTPVVVRIVEIYPHGKDFRYDLSYYGLIPGKYNLATFLRRKDGKPDADLPEIPVTIESLLPPGQIQPHELSPKVSARFGGYRLLALLVAMVWSAGFVFILYALRRKAVSYQAIPTQRLTLAERLRPLVEQAVAGTLNPGQRAELERLLLGYWTRKLGLENRDPAAMMAALRNDPEAGRVVRQLEDWLHRPGGEQDVDVPALLRPYANIPAEESKSEAGVA
jgi:hypothetical protein